MADVLIQEGWSPGLIGRIVSAHALYYAREWSFGAFFEAKVAAELSQFVARYDAEHDAIFHATREGQFLGSLVIDGSDPELQGGLAHLRWFIVTDDARGSGLGRRLMEEALGFLARATFERCYLTTFAGLHAARRLYEASGFVLMQENEAETWGARVREQRFEIQLRG